MSTTGRLPTFQSGPEAITQGVADKGPCTHPAFALAEPALRWLRGFTGQLPDRLAEEDKIQHIVWSLLLMFQTLPVMPMLEAALIVLAIGLAKEWWDIRWGNGFCLYDMVGNGLGIGAGALLHLMAVALLGPRSLIG